MSPSRVCAYCGNGFTLTKREDRHNHNNLTYFCSANCLKDQILGTIDINPYNLPEYLKFDKNNTAIVSDPHAIWDVERKQFFRSAYEKLFADFLDLIEMEWLYEPYYFEVGKSIYVPDFFIPGKDIFIECKGYFLNSSRKKMATFVKQYPTIDILLASWGLKDSLKRFVRDKNVKNSRR